MLLLLLPRQVPEWTKCSSREKRKEKKVEKPFYSDSEGESGPTESADSGEFAVLGVHVQFTCRSPKLDVNLWIKGMFVPVG